MPTTRFRYRVVAFTTTLSALTYLDRVCISILAPQIMRDLHLTALQMSYAFSAFTLAYAGFEIPTARWADRKGCRYVITRIVLWWSVFTMATAGAFRYSALLIVRFLFGVGEAGAWPSAARVFTRWVPARERGRVQGVFFAGAHLSGGLTPIAVTYLAARLPWRAVFLLFGCFGLVWAALWSYWFRDEPREKGGVSTAERDLIEAGRPVSSGHVHGGLRKVLGTPRLVPICLQYFANTYGFYFFITWLPAYLAKARGMANVELAAFAGLPLLLSVIADVSGGFCTDWLSRHFGLRVGRCVLSAAAYLAAALAAVAGTLVTDGRAAGTLIALGGAASMFTLAPAWAVAIELGGENSATLGAVMNTAGQIGGILSPIALAFIVDRFVNWNAPLQILGGLYAIAAVSWLLIEPSRDVRLNGLHVNADM